METLTRNGLRLKYLLNKNFTKSTFPLGKPAFETKLLAKNITADAK